MTKKMFAWCYSVFFLLFCILIIDVHVKAQTTETIITENSQHTLGSSMSNKNRFKRALPTAITGISAAETGRPPKDFIDVSSHNGIPSIEEYQTMKKYGIKGVVVKLTEGDSYRNPLAPQQISNALKANLKVSVYHYAWFNQTEDTEQEAQYLLDFMKELKLPLSTVVVNDSENPRMNLKKVTENALIFSESIKKAGFSKVIHYSSNSWFTEGTLNLNLLGKENCWVAQWPYDPSENNLLHADKASWQWASDLYFPEFSEKHFDISTDYSGTFTKE